MSTFSSTLSRSAEPPAVEVRTVSAPLTVASVSGECFHQAGIATAWMTFSGHPGEKNADALETARLIHQERKSVDLFILGRFGLTSDRLQRVPMATLHLASTTAVEAHSPRALKSG